jgi:endonuclease YncB( thermonuclease family)
MPRRERVRRILDGDTFETDSRKRPVRLAGVDTPEKAQSGFQEAKAALSRMIQGQTVTIDTQARDRYGRSVANVKVGRRSVNQAMERHGK